MRVVVALGRRALLPRAEHHRLGRADVRAAALALAPAALEHELVVCHAAARLAVADLTVPGTRSAGDATAALQGLIGYWLAQELVNAGVPAPVVAVAVQGVVPSGDTPGPGQPDRIAEPDRIVETEAIRLLADRGTLVVCGGGVAVLTDGASLTPADTVVDVDATAALLALELDADRLVLLTDVDGVRGGPGPSRESPIRRATVQEMRSLQLAPTTMGPKVAVGVRFVTGTGRPAVIGAVGDAGAVISGRAGTSIYLDRPGAGAGGWPDRASASVSTGGPTSFDSALSVFTSAAFAAP